MAKQLDGKRIAFLTANEGVEEIELSQPWDAVTKAGATAVLIAPEVGKVQAMNHFDKADTYEAAQSTSDAQVQDFDGLVIPGGVANPDMLRMDTAAVNFVREFFRSGKPMGVICHGPWMLVEADVVKGKKITSWPSLKTDITNAGGEWVDKECVTDKGLVTSRKPDDLPAFCAKIVEEFVEGRHEPRLKEEAHA